MLCNIRFSKNREQREPDPSKLNRSDNSKRHLCQINGFKKCNVPLEPNRSSNFLLRKEVIHPHVPVGIPCYDLTPISGPALDACLLTVSAAASSIATSHGLTGGVYKPRERIHRGILIRDY